MNATYAEICRVGNSEADFQQVQLVHSFFTILLLTINNLNSGKKSKIKKNKLKNS